MTASELMGSEAGSERCFYCGAGCAESHPAAQHRSDTFIGWSDVAFPASGYVCAGCVRATDESDRSRRPRMFSWLITRHDAIAMHKGQLDQIATWCLAPPAPPFAIVAAVGGQKHLIFRAPVNHSREVITVQFELERVTYRPPELAARLDLCKRLAAASGKPALVERPTPQFASRLGKYWADFEPLLIWSHVWSEPLSRLAAWLCPKQEICSNEYPSDITIPAADAIAGRVVRRRRVAAQARGPDGPGLFNPD